MENVIEISKKCGLKPKERVFLQEYFISLELQQAYLKSHVNAKLTPESLQSVSSRYYQKIKAKLDWPAFLEMVGLGMDRLALEIEKGLNAYKTEFYQGQAVATCEDNAVRARTRELLADIHGVKKQEVKISGEIKSKSNLDLSKLSDIELGNLELLTAKAKNGEAASRN